MSTRINSGVTMTMRQRRATTATVAFALGCALITPASHSEALPAAHSEYASVQVDQYAPDPEWVVREWLCQGTVFVLPEQMEQYELLMETGDYTSASADVLGHEDSDLVSRALFAHLIIAGAIAPCEYAQGVQS